jgi:vancomycin resistance protein YoaR
VQEYTSGNTVYAEIYGTKDNRKPSISKAEILDTKPLPETIYHDAPNIPKGTNKIITKGAAGAKTKFTYTITYSDSKQVSQDFMSYYRPIPPEIQVGSQEVAPPVSGQ